MGRSTVPSLERALRRHRSNSVFPNIPFQVFGFVLRQSYTVVQDGLKLSIFPQPLGTEIVGLSHYAPTTVFFYFRDLVGISGFTAWDPLCNKPYKSHKTSDFTYAFYL